MKVYILENDYVKMNEMQDVKLIKIKDEKYNLLIMKDYWPVVGQLKGSIVIEGNEIVSLDKVDAFYALSHNVFWLIIHKREI